MSLFKHKPGKVRDPFDFDIRIPDGWCAHSPDPDPAVQQRTTEEAVDQIIRDEPALAEARNGIIDRMVGFAREANGKGAMAAASLWTLVEDTETAANMMVFAARRDAGEPVEATIARLVQNLSDPDEADTNERDVHEVELPAGPAVRLRVMAQTPEEPGIVIELVQYWLPVRDASHTLIVSCTTPCLVYGDELTAVFDSIAASLELT